MIDHDQPSIILEQRESSGSGRRRHQRHRHQRRRRRLPRRHSAIAMVRVDALVPVERMQSFKTNIAFMKSPGKLLNITRQMTTIDHPDSILKICLPEMETLLLRIYTFSVYGGINSYLERKKDKL